MPANTPVALACANCSISKGVVTDSMLKLENQAHSYLVHKLENLLICYVYLQVIRNLHTACADRIDIVKMVLEFSKSVELHKTEVCYPFLYCSLLC